MSSVESAVSAGTPSSATAVAEPPAPSTPAAPASDPTPAPASPTAPTPTETPTPQAATPEPEEDDFQWPTEGEQPAEPVAAAPEPTTQPTAEDPSNWKADDIQKMLPREVIDKMLQTNKGRNIYQSYMTMRELEKPVAEGGLGYRPSIEQIRTMHQDSNDLQIMVHEFQNAQANPQYAQNWTKQWFQVGQDGRPTQSSLAVASQLAQTLDQHSPELYKAVAYPIVRNYVGELYRQADKLQGQDRIVLLNVARVIQQDIGDPVPEIPQDQWEKPASASPQADPRSVEIDQKLRRIEEFERGQQTAVANAFIARLNGDIRSAVTKDIQYALKPIAEAYAGADGRPSRAYSALESQFHNEVVQRVNQNPAQLRQYIIARDQARATGQPADIQNAARAWAAAARPIITQLRKEYLQDAIARKTAESTTRHQVLAEASQKRGSTSIGQPTEKNLAPEEKPRPGESFTDTIHRRVGGLLGAA